MGARWPFPAAFLLALAALIAVHLPPRPAPPRPVPPPPALAKGATLSASIPRRQRIGQKMEARFILRYDGPGEACIEPEQCSEASIPSGVRITADGKRRAVARRLPSGSMGRIYTGPGFVCISSGRPCEWEQDLNHLFVIDAPGRYVFTTETGPAFRDRPNFQREAFPAIVGSTITIDVAPADSAENLRRMNRLKFEISPVPMGGFYGLDDLVELQDERVIPMVLDLVNDPKQRLPFTALSGFCDRRRLGDAVIEDVRRRRLARKHVELERNAEALAILEIWPCREHERFGAGERAPEIAAAKARWLRTLDRLVMEKN